VHHAGRAQLTGASPAAPQPASDSRLHHANVLELYAVFEDADAFYFVMQCAPLAASACMLAPPDASPPRSQIRAARRPVP
jgi:hypothetical protein